MKTTWSVVALLVFAPIVIAETSATDLAQDDPGDSTVDDRSDLLALRAAWESDTITWELDVGESPGTGNVVGVDSVTYGIHFKVGEREYIAFADRSSYVLGAADGPDWNSGLMEKRGGYWQVTQEGDAPIEDGTTITWTTDDGWLFDERDVPILPGQPLTDIWVESTGAASMFSDLMYPEEQPQDRMPDDGTAGPLVKPADSTARSKYLIFSAAPVRTSNGGPTLLTYPVEVFNGGQETTTFQMSLVDQPEHWTVAISPAELTVDALDSQEVIVVVQSQGGHRHGSDDVFRLLASAPDGEGTIDLTVHYPDIAELSGHHEQVWFHSARQDPIRIGSFGPTEDDTTIGYGPALASSGAHWMNTAEDDEADTDEALGPSYDPDTELQTWAMPLGPAPRIGFDFDMNSTGTLQFRLEPYHDLDIEELALETALEVYEGGKWTPVADIPDVPTFTLPSGGQDFELDITPTRDVIPYSTDMQLRIRIAYDFAPTGPSTAQGTNVPVLVPGGNAILPMDEYQDPLPSELAALLEEQGVLDQDGTIVEPTEVEDHEAPGMGLLGILGALLVVMRARRR